MTLEEGHSYLLKNLELCFNHLLDIHKDLNYLDSSTDEYSDAMNEFLSIQKEIFNLKNIIVVVNKTKKDLED